MANILLIRRKTLFNQSINLSRNQIKHYQLNTFRPYSPTNHLWKFYRRNIAKSIIGVFCLFVCFFVIPLSHYHFSLIRRSHHYRWRAANFDLCSTLMAIEQRGFLCLPHFMWQGTSFLVVISVDPWHTHLLLSVLQRSCHYLFYILYLSVLGFEQPTFLMRGERSNQLHHRN